MRTQRNRIPAFVVLAIALLLPPSAAAGNRTIAEVGVQTDLSRPTANEPADDVADYADYWGVSIDEAVLDLGRQRSAGRLEEQLTSAGTDWFAGLWIEHDPSFHIVVASTKPGNEDLLKLVKASDVVGFVKVRAVARTLDELRTAAARYQSVSGAAYRVRVDITQNMVTIGSSEPQTARDLLDRARVALAGNDEIRFDDTRVVLTAAIQGGRHLDPDCTSGFGLVDLMGFRYASTAAHCLNSLTYQPGGIALNFNFGKFSGSVDMQVASVPSGSTISNFVYDGGHNWPLNTRPMIGTQTRAAQVVGGTYCKFGRTTGWGCGELQSKSEPCQTPAPANTCMFLSRSGVQLANEGDSGGPVFQGFFAAGWIHACIASALTGICLASSPLIYIAEDYIGQLGNGTKVLTSV